MESCISSSIQTALPLTPLSVSSTFWWPWVIIHASSVFASSTVWWYSLMIINWGHHPSLFVSSTVTWPSLMFMWSSSILFCIFHCLMIFSDVNYYGLSPIPFCIFHCLMTFFDVHVVITHPFLTACPFITKQLSAFSKILGSHHESSHLFSKQSWSNFLTVSLVMISIRFWNSNPFIDHLMCPCDEWFSQTFSFVIFPCNCNLAVKVELQIVPIKVINLQVSSKCWLSRKWIIKLYISQAPNLSNLIHFEYHFLSLL